MRTLLDRAGAERAATLLVMLPPANAIGLGANDHFIAGQRLLARGLLSKMESSNASLGVSPQ